jgi:serine/threonine protein kinase
MDGSRHVGRYRIIDFLGSGAMGEVYLAEDPQIERKLAIKTVRLVGRPQEIEDRKRRLLREARAVGKLLHPNVVTLFDAGEEEGMLFLAFEFVAGTDLAGRLEKDPPLSLREVLRIVRQVADALEFAHREGVVHRDIKPSNVLLDAKGRVKVADFGIAKVAGQSTELTVAGSVMGSPQYLSPEQIRGEELDGRSDIFSLGVVLYELLSKKRPFEGDTITTLVYQILHKEPPPISELRAVPERLESLLQRMLAKSRDDRFATAAAVAAEVMACERELSDETLSAPAAALPLEATRVLPPRRSETTAPSPGRHPIPPPPPRAAVHQTPPPKPPPVPPVSLVDQAAARRGNGAGLAAAIVFVLLLIGGAVGGGVWWYFFHRPQAADVAQVGSPPVATSPAPLQSATPAPAAPAPAPSPRESSPAAVAPRLSNQKPPAAAQTPPVHESDKVIPSSQPIATPPPPAVPQMHPPIQESPKAPASQPAQPEEDEEPRRRGGDFGTPDSVMPTGMALVFRPTPADAFVLVDGNQIGRATEWNGQKGGRTYNLSGPGEHQIKIRSEGLKEAKILVQASETAGVTPILVRLRPLAAAQADPTDLKTYRVSEAIAFRVNAARAEIIVDGQPARPASSLGGRFAQPKSWLPLPPGRHRIGVTAPGMERQDFLVEVSAGADKDKERIEVNLQPGGAE